MGVNAEPLLGFDSNDQFFSGHCLRRLFEACSLTFRSRLRITPLQVAVPSFRVKDNAIGFEDHLDTRLENLPIELSESFIVDAIGCVSLE